MAGAGWYGRPGPGRRHHISSDTKLAIRGVPLVVFPWWYALGDSVLIGMG